MKLRLGLIKRFLAGGTILLAVLVTIGVTGGARADAAALSAETPSGHAGTAVQVTGDGYLPLVSIGICWDEPGCSDLGSAQPGLLQTGFTTEVTIPESAPPGEYQIHACQLLSGGLTCSSAGFEVLSTEPPTTTTAPTSTTRPAPTTTTRPAQTTTVAPTTTVGAPVTTSTSDNETSEVVGTEVKVTEVVSTSGSGSQPGGTPTTLPTTTTTSLQDTPNLSRYTPPRVSGTDPASPGGEESGPTIVVQAAPDSESLLSWLDEPVVFWSAWLVAVIVGGSLASLAAWLVRRRRNAS